MLKSIICGTTLMMTLGFAVLPSASEVVYHYDQSRRLIQVGYEDGTIVSYRYDRAGNRTEMIVSHEPFDSDGDGIPDGDGANPCSGGDGIICDDNCPSRANPGQADSDGDGRGDACDNCRDVANPDQKDSEAGEDDNTAQPGMQHYGNACDADYDNNGIVGLEDYIEWNRHYGQSVPPAPDRLDADGDGYVGLSDYNLWRSSFRKAPGPGAVTDEEQ